MALFSLSELLGFFLTILSFCLHKNYTFARGTKGIRTLSVELAPRGVIGREVGYVLTFDGYETALA